MNIKRVWLLISLMLLGMGTSEHDRLAMRNDCVIDPDANWHLAQWRAEQEAQGGTGIYDNNTMCFSAGFSR